MSTERFDAEIKTRVENPVKKQFQRLAKERHLDTADIVREALREYLAKQPATVEKEGVAA
jgi:hypothetical protein